MNKYIVFSLIAIAPLMLRAEDTLIEEVESLESLFESESEPLLSVEEPVVLAESKQLNTPPEVPSSSSSWECRPDIQPYQVSIGHIEGRGVGYDTGYTTLDAFFTRTYGRYIPFLDLKGHVFDNGRLAANLGLGMRYAWKPEKYLFGINGYYDYRQTKRGHYNQVGAGIEAFKNRWEFRANGYLPVGHKKFQYDQTLTGISFKGFQGNNILINEFYDAKVEYAMKGFNAELGAHLIAPRPNYDLYLGAGTYYFIGDVGKKTWGGKIRLTGKVTKYISLEISDSFDRVFHNRFQGQVVFNYPFGSKKLRPQKRPNPATCYTDNLMYARASQPVQRQDIVVVNHKKQPFVIDPIAIDPTTGQPFVVVFVNNTNANLGDGTFENPFQNLSPGDNATNAQTASVPGNTIYVFSGDGTTTNMQQGIVLQANQRFLGSSIPHTYQTTLGSLVIPPQTATIPSIGFMAVSNGFGVRLANGSEVSGFQIAPNTSTTAGAGCIGANVVTGGIITNNILTGEVLGIKLGTNTPVQGDFVITNNTSTSHRGNSVTQGLGLRGDFANGTVLISNNNFSNNIGGGSMMVPAAGGASVVAHASQFPLNIDISNNQFNGNSQAGLSVSLSSLTNGIIGPYTGSVCVTVDGNTLGGNGNGGLVATSSMGVATGFSVPNLIINNNTASLNTPSSTGTGGGIVVGTAGTTSDLCARVTNNTSTINVASGQGGPADFQFSSASTGIPGSTTSFFLEPLVGNTGTWFSSGGDYIVTDAGDCNCP